MIFITRFSKFNLAKIFLVIFVMLNFCLNYKVSASSCTWVGLEDLNFSSSSNWQDCNNSIPTDQDSLIFPEHNQSDLNIDNDLLDLQVDSIYILNNKYKFSGNKIIVNKLIEYNSTSSRPLQFNLDLQINNSLDIFVKNANSVIEFNGAISSSSTASGSLIKTGLGSLILNSKNSYKSLTNLKEGILKVNGFQPQASIVLDSSTIFSGVGNVGGIIANGTSTINLPIDGILIVDGNLQLNPDSFLDVAIENANKFAILEVKGSINLNNATLNLVSYSSSIGSGLNFKIITAKEVIGEFKGLPNYSVINANGILYRVKYFKDRVELESSVLNPTTINVSASSEFPFLPFAIGFLIVSTILARIFSKRLTRSKRINKNFR